MEYIIDTNILVVATIDEFLELEQREKDIYIDFKKLQSTQVVVPDFILMEYAIVMQRVVPVKYKLNDAVNKNISKKIHNNFLKLLKLFNSDFYVCQASRPQVTRAIKVFSNLSYEKKKNKEISLFDIVYTIIALDEGLKPLTLDQHLIDLYSQLQ